MEKRSENMTKLIELKGINKTYKNGDQELFIYGENNQKNGRSIYYFANGDLEETTYVNGVLQVGPTDQWRVFPRRSGGWKSQ